MAKAINSGAGVFDDLLKPKDDPSATLNRTMETLPRQLEQGTVTASAWPIRCSPTDDRFVLIRPVAVGGCGEIWAAEQVSLSRIVAVKVVKDKVRQAASASGNDLAKRVLCHDFHIEAVTTACLEHPNIAPVYDLGIGADGWPVMAMKLVKGESWETALDRDFAHMQPDEYLAKHLPIFIAMMQAVAFAHAKGIVHRDIKPAQVMIGEFGEVHLMDWGLALSVLDPESAALRRELPEGLPGPSTASAPGGTPTYMAPEQTLPTAEQVGIHTDIYLLGGTLYRILTGKPPRRTETRAQCVELAAQGYVAPVEESAPERDLPQELVHLALWALAPTGAERPASVRIMIDEVGNSLSGATARTQAESLFVAATSRYTQLLREEAADYTGYAACLGDLDRVRSLWPKHRAAADLREELIQSYSTRAMEEGDLRLAEGLARQLTAGDLRDRQLKEVCRREKEQEADHAQRRFLRRALVGVLVILGGVGVAFVETSRRSSIRIAEERDAAHSARLLAEAAEDTSEKLRMAAETEQYFANVESIQASLARGLRPRAEVSLFEKSPERLRAFEWGMLAAQANEDLMRLRFYDGIGHSIFNADGSRILSTSRDGRILVWDAGTGRYEETFSPQRGRLFNLSLSPDGNRMMVCANESAASIVNPATGEVITRLTGGGSTPLRFGSWSPCNRWLATTSLDKTVRVWDATSYQLLRTIDEFGVETHTAAFSPDGNVLAVGCLDGAASLWSPATGERLADLGRHGLYTRSLSFNSDGSMLAMTCEDDGVRMFRTPGGMAEEPLRFGTDRKVAALFLPESRLAMLSEAGRVRIIDVETRTEIGTTLSAAPGVSLALSPDNSRLLVGTRSEAVVFSLASLLTKPGRDVLEWNEPGFHALERAMPIFGLTAGREPQWQQRERIWNTDAGRTKITGVGVDVAFDSRYASFSADGKWSFHQETDTLFGHIHATDDGELVYEHPPVKLVAARFTPDSRYLVIAEAGDRVVVLEAGTWRTAFDLVRDPEKKIPAGLESYIPGWLGISPDSRYAVVPYLNGHLTAWDLTTGKVHFETERVRGIGVGVSFAPDGKHFLIAGNDQRVTMWDVATGKMVQEFIGHIGLVSGADFSPDGQRILTFSRDRTARLWEAATGREVIVFYECPPERTIVGGAFINQGKAMLLALDEGQVIHFPTFPWDKQYYREGTPGMTFAERFELRKRMDRLNPATNAADVLAAPESGNF